MTLSGDLKKNKWGNLNCHFRNSKALEKFPNGKTTFFVCYLLSLVSTGTSIWLWKGSFSWRCYSKREHTCRRRSRMSSTWIISLIDWIYWQCLCTHRCTDDILIYRSKQHSTAKSGDDRRAKPNQMKYISFVITMYTDVKIYFRTKIVFN